MDAFTGIACDVVLQKFRAIRGFTQAQAAEWFGVSERTWRRWENTGIVPVPVMKRVRDYARHHPRGKLIHHSF